MIHVGDCLDVMRTMEANSVDSLVTDPPYGLGFMGKAWDHSVPGVPFWTEMLRIMKPGAHLAAFGGTRTFHRMACAIEDAGWELRDTLMWVYGSGFPKSLDVSKAIDKSAGAEREVVGVRTYAGGHVQNSSADKLAPPIGTFVRAQDERIESAPATDDAKQWQGWGTALKPAWEPIILARKPLVGTVAANVLAHGTGGLNIDGCRVGTGEDKGIWPVTGRTDARNSMAGPMAAAQTDTTQGRWPANVIHDGSEEVVSHFPDEAGAAAPVFKRNGDKFRNSYGGFAGSIDEQGSTFQGDSGSAARFFYCAKADRDDRNDGVGNNHPTVKPTDLMRWLCRLITPPGGLILDPFAGSGSTGRAAIAEGFRFQGIELDPAYAAIAEARIRVIRPGFSFGPSL